MASRARQPIPRRSPSSQLLLGQGIAEGETAELDERLVPRRPDANGFHPGNRRVARGFDLAYRFAALRQVKRHLQGVLSAHPADQVLPRREEEIANLERNLGDEVM